METFDHDLKRYLGDVVEFSRICNDFVDAKSSLKELEEMVKRCPQKLDPSEPDPIGRFFARVERLKQAVLPFSNQPNQLSRTKISVGEDQMHSEEEMKDMSIQDVNQPSHESREQSDEGKIPNPSEILAPRSKRTRESEISPEPVPRKVQKTEKQRDDESQVFREQIKKKLLGKIDKLSTQLDSLQVRAQTLWLQGKRHYLEKKSFIKSIERAFENLSCENREWQPVLDFIWTHILTSILRDLKGFSEEICYEQFAVKCDTWEYLAETPCTEIQEMMSAVRDPMPAVICDIIYQALRSCSGSLREDLECFGNTRRTINGLSPILIEALSDILESPFILAAYQQLRATLGSYALKSIGNDQAEKALVTRLGGTSFHGLSLPFKTMLLDDVKPLSKNKTLKNGAILVYFLHELGHQIVRESVTTIKQFYDTSTPKMKKATKSKKPKSAKKPSAAWSPLNPIVPIDDRKFCEQIDKFMPLRRHLEAGDVIENYLFGSHLEYLMIEASEFIMNPANWQKDDFKHIFLEKNKKTSNSDPDSCIALRRGGVKKNFVEMAGCKFAYYGTYC